MPLISIVIPVYNEQECLPALFERLDGLQASGSECYEFIFVDDGSSDESRRIISELAGQHPNVKYVFFSRNFGHEMATTAGIDHATGDAVVGFSKVPLRIGVLLGWLVCILSPAMAAKVFLEKLIWGVPVPGDSRRT